MSNFGLTLNRRSCRSRWWRTDEIGWYVGI